MAKATVQIVDVSLRDGLQNEAAAVDIENRVILAEKLLAAGVTRMELGAFVRADRVPQMAGSAEVVNRVIKDLEEGRLPSVSAQAAKKILFSALVPNVRGMEEASRTPIKEVAIFTAASESFTKANINCTIEESFDRFSGVMEICKIQKIRVRGYLSTCFGCPYEGEVDEGVVVKLTKRLIKMGCFEVSIGDTIGVATPGQVQSVFRKLKKAVPIKKLAGHFHDTRGTALANILASYGLGVRTFDASLGGLGGCPYAPGAAGNVAIEDVVYMFEGMNVSTALNLEALVKANHWFSAIIGKSLPSKMSQAGLPKLTPINGPQPSRKTR